MIPFWQRPFFTDRERRAEPHMILRGAYAGTDGHDPIREPASPLTAARASRAGRPGSRPVCTSLTVATQRVDEARRQTDDAYGLREKHPSSPFAERQFREACQRVKDALAVEAEFSA